MRSRIRNPITAVMICVLLAMNMTGCSGMSSLRREESSAEESGYLIYYLNQEGNGLVSRKYEPKSRDFEGILAELLEAFRNPVSTTYRSAMPEEVRINSTSTGINEIDVDFSAEYLSLDTIREVLLRSALVLTLLRFDDVDTVRFTVDSQSLVVGDTEIGPMTEDTFVVPTGNAINSYRNQTLTLYFPGADGKTLIRELKTIYYSSNVNTERMVLEQMIQGSSNSNLLALTTREVLVNSVKVNDSVCTVDFSREVNDLPFPDSPVDPETVLYAFTNAIIDSAANGNISRVKFLIDGSDDTRFRDQVNLKKEFERNAELISTAGASQETEVLGGS